MHLHHFHGGLRLDGHKQVSTARPIQVLPAPARVLLPLLQHAGVPARACVSVGDRVARGQAIAVAPEGTLPAAAVHASIAGTVTAIARHVLPLSAAGEVEAVAIEGDGSEAWERLAPLLSHPDELDGLDHGLLLDRVRDAGLVGLGGAAFPSVAKLAVARDLLVLNGAECEPWISCDDALMRERADDVVRGGRLLGRIVAAERIVVALEDRMLEAIAAMREAIGRLGEGIELVVVPTRYPQGGERQLIQVLTGREVPRGGLPRDVGVLVHNVGTAAAAWRAAAHGEALTSRIVTVTGPGVRAPCNVEARLGTPVSELLAAAGGLAGDAARLVVGGPLMGLALPDDAQPVTKATNSLLVLDRATVRDPAPEMPCIRCGDCAAACPAMLLPQQLLAFVRAGQWPQAEQHGLFDCIECGCCDLVCPSHIPLVDWYRYGKAELRGRAADAEAAEAARLRFEARNARLAREQAEREARRARAARPSAIHEALARVGAAPPSGEGEGGARGEGA